jgi:hypothetical protein
MPFLYDPKNTDFDFEARSDSWSYSTPNTNTESNNSGTVQTAGIGPGGDRQPYSARARSSQGDPVGPLFVPNFSGGPPILGSIGLRLPSRRSMLSSVLPNLREESRISPVIVRAPRLNSAENTETNTSESTEAENAGVSRDRFRTSHPPNDLDSLRDQARETTLAMREARLAREHGEQAALIFRRYVASTASRRIVSRPNSAEREDAPFHRFTTSLPPRLEASLRRSLIAMTPMERARALVHLEERVAQL